MALHLKSSFSLPLFNYHPLVSLSDPGPDSDGPRLPAPPAAASTSPAPSRFPRLPLFRLHSYRSDADSDTDSEAADTAASPSDATEGRCDAGTLPSDRPQSEMRQGAKVSARREEALSGTLAAHRPHHHRLAPPPSPSLATCTNPLHQHVCIEVPALAHSGHVAALPALPIHLCQAHADSSGLSDRIQMFISSRSNGTTTAPGRGSLQTTKSLPQLLRYAGGASTQSHSLSAMQLAPAREMVRSGSAASLTSTDSTTFSCRYCKMNEEESGEPLISPCACKGSMALVHSSCLLGWALSPYSRGRRDTCEVCHTVYSPEVASTWQSDPRFVEQQQLEQLALQQHAAAPHRCQMCNSLIANDAFVCSPAFLRAIVILAFILLPLLIVGVTLLIFTFAVNIPI